jgi:hypothetical protein
MILVAQINIPRSEWTQDVLDEVQCPVGCSVLDEDLDGGDEEIY